MADLFHKKSCQPQKRRLYKEIVAESPDFEKEEACVIDYLTDYAILTEGEYPLSDEWIDNFFQKTKGLAWKAYKANMSHGVMSEENYQKWKDSGCNLDKIVESQRHRAYCVNPRLPISEYDKSKDKSVMYTDYINCVSDEKISEASARKCEKLGCGKVRNIEENFKGEREDLMCLGKWVEPNGFMHTPDTDAAYHYKMGKDLETVIDVGDNAPVSDKRKAIEHFVSLNHHGGTIFDYACKPRAERSYVSETDFVVMDVLDCLFGVDWET